MKTAWHYIVIIFGILLILIGIAGLVLPVLPGVVPVILGFIILGKKQVLIDWLNKLPKSWRKNIKY